jgi:signal transduction histidine kinase
MIYNLRTKLAVSHLLPVLLLMPLLSLYLLYSLENFFTQNLIRQLNYQARILNDRVERDPQILASASASQVFLSEVASFTDARVMLLALDGTILGSNQVEDQNRVGQRLEYPYLEQAISGETAQGIGPGVSTDVAYVVLPVRDGESVAGLLRVSYEVKALRQQVSQLQYLILGGTILTALLGLALAVGLSTTITRPLQNLTSRVQLVARGNFGVRAPVKGRDEMASLASSFNRMAARLEELEQTRRRQLAAITHELARPLTGMRAAIETLHEETDADPETRGLLLNGVLDELARMQRLVESLQQAQKRFSRPMVLHKEEVSPARVMRATLANYEPLAERSQISFKSDIPDDLPRVFADQDRLIQVLTNLLDNAFKFTPRGGQVLVKASAEPEQVVIAIQDTGVGIANVELPNLFQEFYRGGNATHPPEKRGMGLGLKISREIVSAHGGTIRIESEAGQGTRVIVTLPTLQAQDREPVS